MRCGADERRALEQLCRYTARPALAYERSQCKAVGQEVVKLKTPWRNVITHLVILPLEFMQLSIEWLVCGGQMHWFYVCSGSRADTQSCDWAAQ